MVKYILSLGDEKKKSQPLKGTYTTQDNGKNGTYIFTASYTDKGKGSIGPATADKTIALRNAKIKAVTFDTQKDILKYAVPAVGELAVGLANGSHMVFNDLDLTGLEAISFTVFSDPSRTKGGIMEVRLGSPDGKLIGQAEVKPAPMAQVKATLTNPGGVYNVYFVFKNEKAAGQPLFAVDSITFHKKADFQSMK